MTDGSNLTKALAEKSLNPKITNLVKVKDRFSETLILHEA